MITVGAIAVLGFPRILVLWRGRRSEDWVQAMSMFLPVAIARGLVRGLPVVHVLLSAMVVFLLANPRVALAWPDHHDSFLLVFAALYLIGWAVLASVVLFNKPSVVVPPHLRTQPGALSEWREKNGNGRRGS